MQKKYRPVRKQEDGCQSKSLILGFLTIGLCLLSDMVFAASSGEGIAKVAGQVEGQITAIANLLVIVAYVAGVGFALGGVIKFKAHRDNPQQVPLSAPIVLLAVGACLLFLPSILTTAGETVFGSEGKKASEGIDSF